MAIIKLSGLLTDIRGKIGGTVFKKTSGGLTMQNAYLGKKNISVQTNQSLTINSVLQTAWNNLTEAQQTYWTTWANFMQVGQRKNKSLFLTGYQAFLKVNFYFSFYGRTILTAPSFRKGHIEDVGFVPYLSAGDLLIDQGGVWEESSSILAMWISGTVSSSVNNIGSRMRMINKDVALAGDYDITDEYVSLFGALPSAGDTLFFRYMIIDELSGQLYPFVTTKVNIVSI